MSIVPSTKALRATPLHLDVIVLTELHVAAPTVVAGVVMLGRARVLLC
jgi:hypothetical protein